MLMRKSSKYLLVLLVLLSFSACTTDENEGANSMDTGSSEFVSAEVIEDINASTMLSVINAYTDLNTTNAFGFESAFGYKAVKITYNTKNQNDEDIVASGLLVIPTVMDQYEAALNSIGSSFSVSMLCDNHGTIFTNAEAPSNEETANGAPDYDLATSMTGYAGFAGIFPDYIGYGTSNDENAPYMLQKASARASLDMIKASMKYMSDNGIILNYQLYISGYSQGGHTAMALAEEVENSFPEVDLKGVAPMAGPHDLEGLGNIEVNASHTMVYPAFLAYLADSYSQAYDDVNLSDLVNETNTTKFHSLFDGSKTNVEIHAALGLTTNNGFGAYKANNLFKDTFINDYQNNINNTFKVRLSENSTYDWAPRTRMNLIHCSDDEIIPFSMSQTAYDKFIENGVSSANLTLTPLPTALIDVKTPQTEDNPFLHGRCANTAYGKAVAWFDDIRAGRI